MPTITIYSDINYTPESPVHVWFDLTDANGNVDTYSFGPKEKGVPWGPGDVGVSEDNTRAEISSTCDITQEQYDKMKAEADSLREKPPEYDLSGIFYENCVTFTDYIMEVGGLDLGFGINDPWETWVRLVWHNVSEKWGASIADMVNTTFSIGETMAYDPLTFDLDADGIETLPLDGQNSVLFDHNGDGVKTGTGWVSPDDGFLVRDINGNGTIDTGKELFGDNTVLSDGTTAANGFEALADLDTNADGVIDVNDAAFTELRIWQDANSDAVTQAGELLTLNQAGIASINTAFESSSIAQDGNTISALGSYTKTDGSLSTMGSVASLGNLNLAASTFYTDFITPVALTPQAEALPTMQGSGLVRDMREAA